MPHFVKPTPQVIGPAGHTPIDPERRTRLPADAFRQIPRPTDRWARMRIEGDVTLVEASVLPAGTRLPKDAIVEPSGVVVFADGKRALREEDIEGYEAPEKPADPAPAPLSAPVAVKGE